MKRVLLAVALVALSISEAQAATPRVAPLVTRAKAAIIAKDYLGFRVLVKKAYLGKLNYGEWYGLKNLINAEVTHAGFDLVQLWSARNPGAKSRFDTNLEKADSLMLAGNFSEAFKAYQANLIYVKRLKVYLKSLRTLASVRQLEELDSLYPFVLHSMGRSLYGAGRYDEALVVYSWIRPSYPRFRQVLFEKMWAGFRAGRIDVALGAIASQRSAYFSKYLSPESYLIQTYIYRKLCRTQDVDRVLAEMKEYEAAIQRGDSNAWAASDSDSLVLSRLSEFADPPIPTSGISQAEREKERSTIKAALQQSFEKRKKSLVQDLKTAMAYAHLAGVADSTSSLKPVHEFKGRAELLAQDLEFWPADSAEEWIDEIGTHIFMGDSLCANDSR